MTSYRVTLMRLEVIDFQVEADSPEDAAELYWEVDAAGDPHAETIGVTVTGWDEPLGRSPIALISAGEIYPA